MASGTMNRLYEEDDCLDIKLLNQLSKWILYNRLPSLARHLGFHEAEISIILAYRDPEEQCFQVNGRSLKGNSTILTNSVASYLTNFFLKKIA